MKDVEYELGVGRIAEACLVWVGRLYRPPRRTPLRRSFPETLSLNTQTESVNSTHILLSSVISDILSKFLVISGTCKMFLSVRGVCFMSFKCKKVEPI